MAGFYDNPLSGGLDSGSSAPGVDNPPPSSGTETQPSGSTGTTPGIGSSDYTGGSSGSFDFSKYLPNLSGPNSAMMIPALATAANQYKNADRYMSMVDNLKGTLDPFGSQRPGYQQQLQNFMSNPSQYISQMPSYQAALNLGLGALNRGNMSKSGTVSNADDIAFASQLGSQTFQNMIGDLTPLTGAQFGPQSLASLYGMAIPASVQSRNAALQAMMYPFFQQNPQASGGGAGLPGSLTNPGSGNAPGINIGPGNVPSFNLTPGTDFTPGYGGDIGSQPPPDIPYDPGIPGMGLGGA